MEQENKTAMQIIEDVKEQMCDDYCRYPRELRDEDDLMDVCTCCPMNKLG